MAGYAENTMFFGQIDGKTLNSLGKLDRSVKTLKDRSKQVNDIIDSTNYFVEYLSKYYKVSINANEATSEDVDIFKYLERMATYLLNSDESIALDKAEQKTYIFHNQTMQKYLDREKINVNNSNGQENIVDSENVVHALLAKKQNSRKLKVQTITVEDLKRDDKVGEILREYQLMLNAIDKKLSEPQDKKWAIYTRQKYLVKQDMVDAKDMLLGVWGYNTNFKESHIPDLDIFDFTDFKTVKYLLTFNKPNVSENEDMWCVWQDFIETVKKANLTQEELEIFKCLQDGWKLQEISDEFGIKYHGLYQTTIPRIAKKIMKVGNKYDCTDPKVKEKINNRKEKAKSQE
ncbi:sigma factor [Enterococcus phage nattely]|uniref:Uncharacterized protein n=1 Tax=Enterococcus phage nattely TaxID=2719593 RepID=A0A6G9LKM6_9CAUD|nr:sigma factor [Enterococcus phage nattely]QIQ66190.1 hypothetical protein nattely_23 [Enterococcus phage nattely]